MHGLEFWMYSKTNMEDVTSEKSGLERADSGLFNQLVCSSLGVCLAFLRQELYEYNK
jgi:hypothetical protein